MSTNTKSCSVDISNVLEFNKKSIHFQDETGMCLLPKDLMASRFSSAKTQNQRLDLDGHGGIFCRLSIENDFYILRVVIGLLVIDLRELELVVPLPVEDSGEHGDQKHLHNKELLVHVWSSWWWWERRCTSNNSWVSQHVDNSRLELGQDDDELIQSKLWDNFLECEEDPDMIKHYPNRPQSDDCYCAGKTIYPNCSSIGR